MKGVISMDIINDPVGSRTNPDEIKLFAPTLEETETVAEATVIDQLGISIEDVIELTKNQIRSMINNLLWSLDNPEYGKIIHLTLRPEINPMDLDIYYCVNNAITFNGDEIAEYTTATFAIKTGFGNMVFSVDTTELEIIRSNMKVIPLEDTVTGRAIACYIYDALSNVSNGMVYNEHAARKIHHYLSRFI